ncbi:MAG: hypothetical protein U0572_13105 [Phycisphaerales bacterium]
MPAERDTLRTWSGALHKSFRLLPTTNFPNDELRAFLVGGSGTPAAEVLAALPFDTSRSNRDGAERPDPKRYRDAKQVFEASGLLWEAEDETIQLTALGDAVRRFLPLANERNVGLIARHAAMGLSFAQLRNPTGAGRRYHPSMTVFPFRFIWQAMLSLDGKINSDELNRAIFRVHNAAALPAAIDSIRRYRRTEDLTALGDETISGDAKNDRLIPVISLASFGWTLMNQKNKAGYYTIKDGCSRLLEVAVSLPARHREFRSVRDYVDAIASSACLPRDLR